MANAAKSESVITRDIAEKEVQSWIEHKRLRRSKIERVKDSIEDLTDLVEDGVISIDPETFVITHSLSIEAGGKKTLTYKPRLKNGELAQRLSAAGSTNLEKRMAAYVGALTEESIGVIGLMDTVDYDVSQTIALFFM